MTRPPTAAEAGEALARYRRLRLARPDLTPDQAAALATGQPLDRQEAAA